MLQFDPRDSNATTWIDKPIFTTDPEINRELKSSWIGAIRKQFQPYFVHRTVVFWSFLYSVDPWIYNYYPPASVHFQKPILLRKNFAANIYQRSGLWLKNYFPVLFKTLTYAILAAVLLGIALFKKRFIAAIICSVALFYVLPFFFIAPGFDYRYTYPVLILVLMGVFVLWIEECSPQSQKASLGARS